MNQAQSREAIGVGALLAAVPFVARLDGLVVSALLTLLLTVLVVAEQSRGAH
jgi:hypothetical protein